VARALAIADWFLRPGLRRQYGGPFNDQRARARLVAELAGLGAIQAAVETGTYRGTTTLFLARELAGKPVHSVEIDPRFHHYARLRTRGQREVHLELGDSRDFLRRLARDPASPRTDVLFYLDAHAPGNAPLREELELIGRGWVEPVILIDDFEVPGDPGYGFNDGLDRTILPAELRAFYPTTPSAEETGYRRGCVLLARPGPWTERLKDIALVAPSA
jgi:predicted O-methyltransferase YrrM